MEEDGEHMFFGSVMDDDDAQEQQRAYEEKRRLKEQRIASGVDQRIDGVSGESPTAASDGGLSLEEYETKWGFTLVELQAASKVVSVLFNNPALFVGDPYLAESRLYTMISRDRKTKRENKDVYRQVMNEEKSRRERVLRQQDVETIKKTTMKRERDDALNALLLAPPPTAPNDNDTLLITAAAVGQSVGGQDKEGGDSAPSTELPVPTNTASSADTCAVSDRFRVIGALEALVHLHSALYMMLQPAEMLEAPLATASVAQEEDGTGLATAPLAGMTVCEALQRQVAHWTAVLYRFVPHPFGSQMPPPIVLSTNAASSSASSVSSDALRCRTVRSMVAQLVDQVVASKWAVPLRLPTTRSDVTERFGWLLLTMKELLQRSDSLFGSVENTMAAETVEVSIESTQQWLRETGDASVAPPPPGWGPFLSCVTGAVESAAQSPSDVDLVTQTMMAWLLHAALSTKSGSSEGDVRTQLAAVTDALRYGQTATASEGGSALLFSRKGTLRLGYLCSFMIAAVDPPTADDDAPESLAPPDVHVCVCRSLQYCRPVPHSDELVMNRVQKCHTCKRKYQTLHPYYYSLCGTCGEFNYQKRMMTRDLRGKVVLLTGCRIKIGYAMAISLLRCGATLLGTTRFAHDAVARFMEEPDYDVWRERLHLFSLDLRDMWMVTQFCGFLTQKFPKLFAIINNAAQTIARTPEYTAALRNLEVQPPPMLRSSLEQDQKGDEWYHFFARNSSVTIGMPLQMEHRPEEHPSPFLLDKNNAQAAAPHVQTDRGAALPPTNPSQTTEASTTTIVAAMVQPHEKMVYDRYDTQTEAMDLRSTNSWTMNLHEVQGSEAAEVMAINALSPFVLNSRLKPLLTNRAGDSTTTEARFIINVSAMEGQFYRFKQTTHPHTNMAKAALNMMTRTSAEDYAQSGIYMNSVDTGWITDESPVQKKQRRADDFMLCPLDEVDAAARCLDLIYMDSREYGKFWKDFHVIPW